MAPERWVTLRDVYRCTLDPDRIEGRIAEVEAWVEPPAAVRIAHADLVAERNALAASWKQAAGGKARVAHDPAMREQLKSLGIAFEVESAAAADPARRKRLDAVRRWYVQDWLTLEPKLRSSIIEGLSVFLRVRPAGRGRSVLSAEAAEPMRAPCRRPPLRRRRPSPGSYRRLTG